MSALGLRSESAAANQHDAIKAFVQGTIAEAAPVVPISAQLKYNIDAVCEYIVKKVRLLMGWNALARVMVWLPEGMLAVSEPCSAMCFTWSCVCLPVLVDMH